jgi:hypothetical protein
LDQGDGAIGRDIHRDQCTKWVCQDLCNECRIELTLRPEICDRRPPGSWQWPGPLVAAPLAPQRDRPRLILLKESESRVRNNRSDKAEGVWQLIPDSYQATVPLASPLPRRGEGRLRHELTDAASKLRVPQARTYMLQSIMHFGECSMFKIPMLCTMLIAASFCAPVTNAQQPEPIKRTLLQKGTSPETEW